MKAICLQDKEECTPKLWEDKLGEQNECGIAMAALGRLHMEQKVPPARGLYGKESVASRELADFSWIFHQGMIFTPL